MVCLSTLLICAVLSSFASDSVLTLDGGFHRVLRFSPPVTTDKSRISRNMAEKVTKNQNPLS